MSVDFYECDCCEESRYEEFVGHCNKCGHSLCTDCLANNDINSEYAYRYGEKCDGTAEQAEKYGFKVGNYEIGDIIDDTGISSKYCPFCNGEEVHNDDLLDFAITKLGISRDQLISEFKKNRIN
jgi:hypothetical protein